MRTVLAQGLVMLVLLANAGAAQPEDSGLKAKTAPAHPRIHRFHQVGLASWYGKHFHGKKTASGETYDMFQFTAAHPRLPLGTLLRVTNLHNGHWVIVRVNDRGPVPKSRIIDLSYGAAQMIGLRRQGTERVRLDVVAPTEVALLGPGLEEPQ
jgi:rare lipoprotein A